MKKVTEFQIELHRLALNFSSCGRYLFVTSKSTRSSPGTSLTSLVNIKECKAGKSLQEEVTIKV